MIRSEMGTFAAGMLLLLCAAVTAGVSGSDDSGRVVRGHTVAFRLFGFFRCSFKFSEEEACDCPSD